MNIVKQNNKQTVAFGNLNAGDLFMWNEKYCIKIKEFQCDDFFVTNAIGVKDGGSYAFASTDEVYKVDHELIIK